ncbi:tRNA-modifying protein YgfZ [Gallaecimonas kandeliae]|uniref:tRNA-modifying protein YgfZ n=1 Tax=Gallaecimonas kandeliae TaxID=3029055 RepID=UPI002648B7BE|nr:tRNA-modifying protein YgfZ [Gallaecimonas kandeliae]WKE66413.1 tRNA-modifying protein YgfZ [Gallaecimonas kandeliae]
MSSWQSILGTLPSKALPKALPPLALIPLTELGLVRLAGIEAAKFLQGQITADIQALAKDRASLAAQCDPKGKMLGLFTALWQGEDLLLLQARDAIPQQLPGMAKYAVFNKVTLSDASEELLLLGLAGSQASAALTAAGVPVPQEVMEVTQLENGLVLNQGGRYLLALPLEAMQALVAKLDGAWFEPAAWQGLDVLAGQPWLPAALQGEYIPQQLNLDGLGGISFEKGCYTGQEVVARMHYRGGNKRTLWHLAGKAATSPKASDELELKLGDSYRRGGVVVAAYRFAEGELHLLAVAANDLEPDSQFRLKGDEASQLALAP